MYNAGRLGCFLAQYKRFGGTQITQVERLLLSDYSDRPAFETIRPREQRAALVFNSPHSGRDYPDRFLDQTRLDELSIRQSEDAYVDELFARAPHLGAPMLRAHFPRAYLDVNREPYELDPTMFADPLPDNYNTSSPRVAAGLGTIARIVAEKKSIYRTKLSLNDAKMRIEGIYKPYHSTLQKLLSETLNQFGIALLIDCHSMPNLDKRGNSIAPDIVLGDRFGSTCHPMITELADTLFTTSGLKVARNRPYAGGFTTKTYGQPANNVHALQIEISRHLYMNEVTLKKNANFDNMKRLIDQLVSLLIRLDVSELIDRKLAAE